MTIIDSRGLHPRLMYAALSGLWFGAVCPFRSGVRQGSPCLYRINAVPILDSRGLHPRLMYDALSGLGLVLFVISGLA